MTSRTSQGRRGRYDSAPSLFAIARKFVDCSPSINDYDRNIVHGYLRSRDIARLSELGALSDGVAITPSLLALRQVACLFKKNSSFSDNVKCTQAARIAFLKAEERCRRTNRRLTFYDSYPDRMGQSLARTLTRVRQVIAEVLGEVSSVAADIQREVKLTSGATSTTTKDRSQAFRKIRHEIITYPGLVPITTAYLKAVGVERTDYSVLPTLENRISFVPKNHKTHRTIACEAMHAVPFQLAVEKYLKRRLRRIGVHLNDQRLNQSLAREGSIFGSYATLDLEAASDSLSTATILTLLPYEWARFLMRFRAQRYVLPDGTSQDYAKFSSMGNGLTFALESLVFAAIARACSGKDKYAVYGDDIIVATPHVAKVTECLAFLGFRLNHSKSFHTHPDFRESCGCDWWGGRLVTPFYARCAPTGKQRSEWCHLINGLARTSESTDFISYLAGVAKSLGLPVVPVNDDTTSGVFVDVTTAYRHKLLYVPKEASKGAWVPTFRGYQTTPLVVRRKGLRSYLLWFMASKAFSRFDKVDRRLQQEMWATGETSLHVIGTRTVIANRTFNPTLQPTTSAYLMADAMFGS